VQIVKLLVVLTLEVALVAAAVPFTVSAPYSRVAANGIGSTATSPFTLVRDATAP